MRHKKNRLIEINTGMQKRSLVMRNLLTSLVKHGEIVTTPKRAKVLKAFADHFFSRLMGNFVKYQQASDVRRESIRFVKDTIFGNDEWKKVVNDLVPQFRSQWRSSSFTSIFKLWYRPGDWVEKILVKLL